MSYDVIPNLQIRNLYDPDSQRNISLDSSENKPIILFVQGHRSQIWSAIVKDDDRFHAMSGKGNPHGNYTITDPSDSNTFDTVGLFAKYRQLILWGFDSLPSEAQRMKVIRGEYNPFSAWLNVISTDSLHNYQQVTNVTFAGPDSVVFNDKFNALCVLMYWLAKPFFRAYTSDSIYIVTSNKQ